MFLQDLVFLAEQADVAVYNVTLFLGAKAIIPAGAGPFTSIAETGGAGEEGTHNLSPTTPAYVRPSAQIVCRATDYLVARAKAEEFWLLFNFVNQFVNGTWYRIIGPKQEPFELPADDAGRARSAFNIECVKRLSPLTS